MNVDIRDIWSKINTTIYYYTFPHPRWSDCCPVCKSNKRKSRIVTGCVTIGFVGIMLGVIV